MAVVNGMTLSPHAPGRTDHAFVVRRPRPTDAVGDSLRRIFAAGASLPQDLQRLLHRLDRS